MTIVARYPGYCSRCGLSITIGQQIEWARGARPRHTTCPAIPSHLQDPGVVRTEADAQQRLYVERTRLRHTDAWREHSHEED